MDSRMISVLKLLSDTKYTTSRNLALKLGCSVKTVKNLINDHRDDLRTCGVKLISVVGVGYKIEIEDFAKYQAVCYAGGEGEDDTKKILLRLIMNADYTPIEELAVSFYRDRMTVERLIPKIAEQAAGYGLTLVSKPRRGIRLEGTEKAFRLCYVSCILNTNMEDYQDNLPGIQSLLRDILEDEKFDMNDMALNNLSLHILIAIYRIERNHVIEEELHTPEIMRKDEYRIAVRIAKEIEKKFRLSLPENEVIYITTHLYGKQIINNSQYVDGKVLRLIDDILEKIHGEKGIDFRDNMELRTFMALHLQPMLARVKFDIQQSNPMLVNIKREMGVAYECALIAKLVMEERGNNPILEDEVAFLALHFALALQKGRKEHAPKKIIVVCTSGMGTARLLQYRLQVKYDMKAEDIEFYSAFQLKDKKLDEYACILTTIPLFETYPIPVIVVDPSYGEDLAINKIEPLLAKGTMETNSIIRQELIFPSLRLDSKEEVLHFLSEQLIHVYGLSETFYDEVRRRETLSSTEIGNLTALPHPLDYDGPSLFAASFLAKPIQWHKMKVKYVFLRALPKKETDFTRYASDKITAALCDEEKLMRMEEEPTAANIEGLLFG